MYNPSRPFLRHRVNSWASTARLLSPLRCAPLPHRRAWCAGWLTAAHCGSQASRCTPHTLLVHPPDLPAAPVRLPLAAASMAP